MTTWMPLVAALLLLLTAGPAVGQVVFQSTSGDITATAANCVTATACVVMPLASRTSNASFVVTGTWVATLTFEGTVSDMTVAANRTAGSPTWFALNVQAFGSTTFVTTATANGQWVGGYALTGIRVRASAYTSGTATVAMLVTSARGGGSGGGGAPTGATYITQTTNAELTAEQALSALDTGVMLNTTGTGVVSIYAGSACTNQFVRSLNASGAATCASPAGSDFATQTANTLFTGPASGGAATPTFRAMVAADLGTTLIPQFAGLGIGGAGASDQILVPDGTATVAAYAFTSVAGMGLSRSANTLRLLAPGAFAFYTGGNPLTFLGANINGEVSTVSGGRFTWTASGTDSSGAPDTNINRAVAGDIGIGTTASNTAGGVRLSRVSLAAVLAMSATAPTVSGFCTSPSVPANNGTAAFTVNVGTSCTGISTGTITLPAATTAWVCQAQNVTTPASFIVGQTGGTTTTATVTNYSRTTGLAADWTASDVIRFSCMGY